MEIGDSVRFKRVSSTCYIETSSEKCLSFPSNFKPPRFTYTIIAINYNIPVIFDGTNFDVIIQYNNYLVFTKLDNLEKVEHG